MYCFFYFLKMLFKPTSSFWKCFTWFTYSLTIQSVWIMSRSEIWDGCQCVMGDFRFFLIFIVFINQVKRYGLMQGRIQDFQLGGGAHKKKCAERREARKFLGYFVWKITILHQKIIFFPIAEGGAKIVGVFRVKNHDFTPKNHIFSNFRGGARWIRPCNESLCSGVLSINAVNISPTTHEAIWSFFSSNLQWR